jgi:hypothetical protein
MITFNVKTNYKIAILIIIQSSMLKIKISKKNTIKSLILWIGFIETLERALATHGDTLIIR